MRRAGRRLPWPAVAATQAVGSAAPWLVRQLQGELASGVPLTHDSYRLLCAAEREIKAAEGRGGRDGARGGRPQAPNKGQKEVVASG